MPSAMLRLSCMAPETIPMRSSHHSSTICAPKDSMLPASCSAAVHAGPDADAHRACWEPQSSQAGYCATQLQDLGARLGLALDRRPDLIVLNRFGWLEASGSGLLSLLAHAIERDVPVAIAVPEGLFSRWLTVAQG